MNLGIFTGNLGRDVEVRHTNAGKAIASFALAVKSGWGDNQKTMWVRCVLFGKRAEGGLIQYLTKGTQVAVSGEMSLNEWTDKDGNAKQTLECKVGELDLIGGKQQAPQRQAAPQQAAPVDLDDALPF